MSLNLVSEEDSRFLRVVRMLMYFAMLALLAWITSKLVGCATLDRFFGDDGGMPNVAPMHDLDTDDPKFKRITDGGIE